MMLQQTQVATVIAYYDRFIEKFPTVGALASAKETEVLKLWEGLGYYRRARHLHAAARLVVRELNSQFPQSRDEILKLPGVGAYSSGSILAIAFRKRVAALDGNLIRVYSRHRGIRDAVDEGKTLKKLWEIAESEVPHKPEDIREFTEGMMELGALVCTPKNPKCLICPVREDCVARQKNWIDQIPKKARKMVRIKKYEEVFLIRDRKGRVAVGEIGSDLKYSHFHRLPFRETDQLCSGTVRGSKVKRFRYSVTNRDFEVSVRQVSKVPVSLGKVTFMSSDQIRRALLPAIDRKILKASLEE